MAGDQVLVRATISDDGRTVIVAPGVELPVNSVEIAAELPPIAHDFPVGLVLLFESHGDLREFVATYQAEEI